jgi:predicted deacylase
VDALMELVREHFADDGSGARHELVSYQLGPASGAPLIHLQAALHADEQPGTMVLHHLLDRLEKAEAGGLLRARFTVFPSVNPIGLGTRILTSHIGRYDLASGVNHNRRWPDLFGAISAQVLDLLGSDPTENIAAVRKALGDWIDMLPPATAIQEMRRAILRSAAQADVVLDLHCDSDSLMHIFTSPEMSQSMAELGGYMGVAAVLTAADSGGGSFDEVLPVFWRKLAQTSPRHPLPIPVDTATLEYRGRADVEDATGRDDAERLYRWLCARGYIAGEAGEPPSPAPVRPFEATEVVRAPKAGLLAYRVALGQRVKTGEVIADLIAAHGDAPFRERIPVHATTDGFVLSRQLVRQVSRNGLVAKIVGDAVLPARAGGYLLED